MASNVESVRRAKDYIPFESFSLNFQRARLTDEQFETLCRNHPDLSFELSAKGELTVMPPTLPDSGWRNSELIIDIGNWARADKTGIVFDSSTIFTFPNGAKRSPDVAWLKREKWDNLSQSEREKISRLVPDFIVELRSSTDTIKSLQSKMREYVENGVRLGWLIDPKNKKVYVYRAGGETEILENPETVSGEDVLEGFRLNVREIW